nr:glycerophosphoryl diester phosphodiesterase membrane domain-containing protein [Erythrobacter ani]
MVFGTAIAGVVVTYWLYAGMVGRTAAPGFERFWPWLGVYILSSLGILFGFAMLIVPGIILCVRWAMVLPLVIGAKGPAMASFGESWEKTRGHGWPIFGAFVVLFIGLLIVGLILDGLTELIGGSSSIPELIIMAASEGIYTAIFVALSVAIYRLLNSNTDELAEVFE